MHPVYAPGAVNLRGSAGSGNLKGANQLQGRPWVPALIFQGFSLLLSFLLESGSTRQELHFGEVNCGTPGGHLVWIPLGECLSFAHFFFAIG